MDRRAIAFVVAVAALHAGLSYVAIAREGSWRQVPSWDGAAFHGLALDAKHAAESDGVAGLVRFWMHGTGVHAPLVPVVSGLLQIVFGESRAVAEVVLPLATLAMVAGTFVAVSRLYGRATAYAASALATAFPIVLTLARCYFLEHPAAGMFALAMAALVASDAFDRRGPTLAFGVLAGLTCVTRSGAPAWLAGPTLVAAFVAMRRAQPIRRVARCAVAVVLAVALAATWYGPNLSAIATYLHRYTYGEQAAAYAGGSSFTLANLAYLLEANVVDGPGLPMAAVAAVALASAGIATRGGALRSAVMPALGAAWAIDLVLLWVAAQHTGARLFEPLMPIVAVGVVRSIAFVPWPRVRWGLAIAVALAALHHVVGMTLTFPVPHASLVDGAVRVGPVHLWNHRSSFLDGAAQVAMQDPDADLRIPAVVDRIETLRLAANAFVYVAADHPFFQVNSIRLEALRRRHTWVFGTAPMLRDRERPDWSSQIVSDALAADAVVVRAGVGTLGAGDYEPELARDLLPFEALVPVGEPISLDDGSRVFVLRRAPQAEVVVEPPRGLMPAFATFEGERLALEGVSIHELGNARLVTLCLLAADRPNASPAIFVHLVDGETIVGAHDVAARPFGNSDAPSGDGPWRIVVRVRADGVIPADARARCEVAVGALAPDGVRRLRVDSKLPVDDGGTRVRCARLP